MPLKCWYNWTQKERDVDSKDDLIWRVCRHPTSTSLSVALNRLFYHHLLFPCDIFKLIAEMAFNNKQNLLVWLDAFLFGLFLYSGQDEGENDKTLLCLMSMVYHWGCGGRRLEALQELLSHHAGKGGDERWNLCLSWQAGTVTAAQIAQAPKETAANCGVAREETGRDWGNAEPAARVPVPRPRLQTQTAKVPACHQGHTDGLLLGGCGCNTDLRAKSPPLCSSPHSYSHYSSANQHVHHSWKNTLCLQ